MKTNNDILVIGDVHFKPGVTNERATKLGRFIADRQPSKIVQIGDMADLPSLSLFDVGKKTFEGRNLTADYKAVHDGLKKIKEPIDLLNEELKERKVRQYRPEMYITLGNHCNRINKAINSDRKLEGTISIDDLRYEEFGWQVVPFLEPLLLSGVTFQHYFTSGLMDRSIGGENVARTILKKYHSSCVQGHSHQLHLAYDVNAIGDHIFSLVAGCYFDHIEEWQSIQSQRSFWRGVILLKDVKDGVPRGGIETVTLDYIKQNY